MIQKIAILMLGIVVGGFAVWGYLFNLQGEWAEREAFIQPTAAVSKSVVVLESLHAGDTEAAIEILEISLDGGLVGLSVYKPDEFPSAQHDLIGGTLAMAKEYRSRHPRTNENLEVETAIIQALSNAN